MQDTPVYVLKDADDNIAAATASRKRALDLWSKLSDAGTYGDWLFEIWHGAALYYRSPADLLHGED